MRVQLLLLLLLLLLLGGSSGMRIHFPWQVRHWCDVVVAPHWPFAYQKQPGQAYEDKGLTASSWQHLGHHCVTFGAQTKCFNCENFKCGTALDEFCHYQIQGMQWANLPKNIPTVTGVPWAVGVTVQHRYDFGRADRVCVMLSGDDCTLPTTTNFKSCAVRCWGATGIDSFKPTPYGWFKPKTRGNPQGKVSTLAGSLLAGYKDGTGTNARFNNPQGLVVDDDRTIYLCDTHNHRIRKIDRNGVVTTVAGSGPTGADNGGFADGPAASARFSNPTGIGLYHVGTSAADRRTVLLVTDSNNHRVRKIDNGIVSTHAGAIKGLADGLGTAARFDTPLGIAVDPHGVAFVADSLNYIIRRIETNGFTWTLAGVYQKAPNEQPGCPPPCLMGVPGINDGPLREAHFYYPFGLTLGLNGTLWIADGDRIRRMSTTNATMSEIQGVHSENRVVTVAGGNQEGERDGIGQEATFNKPTGMTIDAKGRLYIADSVACHIRRLQEAKFVAKSIQCTDRFVDLVVPQGCSMYDAAVDEVDQRASPVTSNIYYNYKMYVMDPARTELGRIIKPCMGSPPYDMGVQSNQATLGPYQGTGHKVLDVKEDTNDGTTMRFYCPGGCADIAAGEVAVGRPSGVYGTDIYSDQSLICAAAIHAGAIDDAGGIFSVTVERGYGSRASITFANGHNVQLTGSTRHGVKSSPQTSAVRTFSVHPYPVSLVEVETIAGAPSSPLVTNCGYLDGQPPQEMKFRVPSNVAMYVNATLSQTEFLYIADSGNNMIRMVTAVCSKVCENGGLCVSEEQCSCTNGWTGDDCTIPVCSATCKAAANRVCTGPNDCTCKPGFTGVNCDSPLCVQDCGAHGVCTAPDTCTCDYGWFDANCTTPVCTQTCGNGGNCTAPDTCSCPLQWTGSSCRVPICDQTCKHGGVCIAPNTCRCTPGWSGYDCSRPVCQQGFFRPDPIKYYAPADAVRYKTWKLYTPCNNSDWCTATNGFDCAQLQRHWTSLQVLNDRRVTGHMELPPACFPMELTTTAATFFRMLNEVENLTPYARITPLTPYGWGPTRYTHPWSSPDNRSVSDRQIAMVQWQEANQGVYLCANGGNCTAPDTCTCAPGWIGYDCRTPVCGQGYHEPSLKSNYLQYNGLQGTYECSIRALTIWENPKTVKGKFQGYVHGHPNYYSRYMDSTMGWPNLHRKLPPLGDYTQEGWRRDGWWEKTGAVWTKGKCDIEYNRTCSAHAKMVDLRTDTIHPVDDVEEAFSTTGRVFYDIWRETATGRWSEIGGECVDHVLRGCYNNGTCVAPNTCVCPPGWEGTDCSIPICSQAQVDITNTWGINATYVESEGKSIQYRECPNRSNCTLPGVCTCEKGWTGVNCTEPLCAQECLNGGKCILPDTCECVVEPAKLIIDGRDVFKNGRNIPIFMKDDGEQQDSGWTGYDCGTPICVQASAWVPDVSQPPYTVLQSTSNDGRSFQGGCDPPGRFTNPNRTRISEANLCGVSSWYQGVYQNSWDNDLIGSGKSLNSKGRSVRVNYPNYIKVTQTLFIKGPTIYGEGIYECYNGGSCIAPDVCECTDGWQGYDCNTPTCRHTNLFGEITGCLNGGICGALNNCTCMQSQSLLSSVFPGDPEGITGYTGADCTMAICTQGFYDPDCVGVAPERTGVSSGGQGCYRCANGGNCTAPDFCTCADNWSGHDCSIPVCSASADAKTVKNLNTVDPAKVVAFEQDPCGQDQLEMFNGALVGHGNCSTPGQCTCLCRQRTWLNEDEEFVELPWHDPLDRALPPGYEFGFSDCLDGFQGNLNDDGTFHTCHMRIYVPTWYERYSQLLIGVGSVVGIVGFFSYLYIRRKLQQRYRLKKAELRRSRRSSEESANSRLSEQSS